MEENSGVNIGGNIGFNTGVGVNCRIGGYASGTLGTLDISDVPMFVNDGTCIENLSDFPLVLP